MTQTEQQIIQDPVQDLVRILEGYEKGTGGMNSKYAQAIAQTAVPIRDMYIDKAESEGIHNFFNELPNVSELAAYTNYLLATSENSDLNVKKHLDSDRFAFAVQCLGNYIETATRHPTAEDGELSDNLYWLQPVDEFFENGDFQIVGLRVEYDITHDKEHNVVDAAKKVNGYLQAVEFVYGSNEQSKEILKQLKGRAKVMGEAVKQVYQKGIKGELRKSELDAFYSNIIGLKRMIDTYASVEHKRKNKLIQRDIRKEIDTPEKRKVLLSLDKKVTEHLEKGDIAGRAGKVFELLGKTWPYMKRSYNPEDFSFKDINLSHVVSGEAVKYQKELVYNMITNDENYRDFEKLITDINKGVQKRVAGGEKREAAALSELKKAIGTANLEKYKTMFAWSELFPTETFGAYETSNIVAERLGVNVAELKKKMGNEENSRFWNTLSRVGKFFTRKIF